MAMVHNIVAVGVFPDQEQARGAIDELRRAGFNNDEIGFLTRVRAADPEATVAADAASGMIGGGVIGGVLGAAASLLIPGLGPAIAGGILAVTFGGAALGAAAGGLVGAFRGLGLSERDARFYQQELAAGHTIVTVKTPDETGYNDALAILRENGAYDATTQRGVINATPPVRPYGTTDHEDTNNPDTPNATNE
jgi:hypothetical protein